MRTLSLLLVLSACSTGYKPDPNRVARTVTSADGDIGVVVAGQQQTAWELYAALSEGHDDNVFFSPFSVTSALGMTLAGAEGQTATEMSDVLHVDLAEAAWHTALGELTQDLSGDKARAYRLDIANRLFGQSDFAWAQPFLDVCSEDYGAPFEPWDFRADPEGGRERVNAWVEEMTQDRITDLLPPNSVTSDTRLVLANAIYFLADWASAFDRNDTTDAAFHKLDGSTVQAPMMTLNTEDLDEHQVQAGLIELGYVVKLPYQDHEVSMVLIVPRELDGLPDVEAALSAETFRSWLAALETTDATVRLPRFEIEHEVDLVPVLAALGMPSAFDSLTADFTGMISPEQDADLYIDGVYHKAFIKVDEVGTEAAAATGVVVNDESASMFYVAADRPFLFVIRDELTGALLFVGRVMDPS